MRPKSWSSWPTRSPRCARSSTPTTGASRPRKASSTNRHRNRRMLAEGVALRAAGGREALRAGLGVRLAVIGKGGAGKTVTSSTLARLYTQAGRKVFACDLDVNPGLAISLGLPATEGGMPPGSIEEHPGSIYGWQLTGAMTPIQAVEHFASVRPDGVRLLGLGKIGPSP